MELYASPEMYERIVHYDEEKEVQIRLTVSTFSWNRISTPT